MFETQYTLLFLAGVLLTIGAWTDRAAGFSAGAGVFVWGILGFASTALVAPDPGGGTLTQSSTALAWLCFGNAAMHAIALVMHLHEVLVEADDDAEQLDPIGIADETETDMPDFSSEFTDS
jgi:hypothetical protein